MPFKTIERGIKSVGRTLKSAGRTVKREVKKAVRSDIGRAVISIGASIAAPYLAPKIATALGASTTVGIAFVNAGTHAAVHGTAAAITGGDVTRAALTGGIAGGMSAIPAIDRLPGYQSGAITGAISQGIGAAYAGEDAARAALAGGVTGGIGGGLSDFREGRGFFGGRNPEFDADVPPGIAPTSEPASRGGGSLLAEGEGAGLTLAPAAETQMEMLARQNMGLFGDKSQQAMLNAQEVGLSPGPTFGPIPGSPAAETQMEMLARQNMGLFGDKSQQAMLNAQEVGLSPGPTSGPIPGSPTDIFTRAPSSPAVGPGTVTPTEGSRLTLGAPEDRVQLNRVDSPEGNILSQVWGNITDRATDPERLTDLAILAGASVLPSLIAGPPPGMPDFAPPEDFDVNQMREGLTEEEQWLLDQQIAELQRLYETDQELFVERMNMVRSLLSQAEYYDPDYWGTMAQRNVRSTMARQAREAEREAMLTGRPISETASRQNALNAAIAGETGYLAGVDTAARQQMRATTSAMGQLPRTGPQTFGNYTPNITAMTGLGMDRMGSAFDRAKALQYMQMNHFDLQSQDYARRLAALGNMTGSMAGAFLYPRNQGATG